MKSSINKMVQSQRSRSEGPWGHSSSSAEHVEICQFVALSAADEEPHAVVDLALRIM